MERIALLACVLIPVPSVLGHSYVTYVSTPITPPVEFGWWLPVAIALLFASTLVAFRLVLRHSLRAAVIRAFFGVALFSICFYQFGVCAATATTAPPAGLGPPSPTYWGRGWSDCGPTFLTWNLIGSAFLVGSALLLAGRRQPWRRRFGVAAITGVTYFLALTPYLVRRAYVHGWAGGYVHMECASRLDRLTDALCGYVDAHGGRLPEAGDIDELTGRILPYIKNERPRFSSYPLSLCPVGAAFERSPRKYHWDRALSGRRLNELGEDRLMIHGLIVCPYHERQGSSGYLRIMESLETAASQPASGQTDGSGDIR